MDMLRKVMEDSTKLVVIGAPAGYGVRRAVANQVASIGAKVTLVTSSPMETCWRMDFARAVPHSTDITHCTPYRFLKGLSKVSGVVVVDAIFKDDKMYKKVMQRVIDVLPEASLVVVLV